MTSQPQKSLVHVHVTPTELDGKPAAVLMAMPGSALAGHHAEFLALKAEADALAERLKGINAALKTEAQKAAPGFEKLVIHTPGQTNALDVSASWPNRFNGKKLKEGYPQIYDLFVSLATTPTWSTHIVKS